MFTCQTQRQTTSLQTVFLHPVSCLKCSLCPREIAWHSKKIPYGYAVPNLGLQQNPLDVHPDPPFPVDLLAKFLGCLTGALPETNFCLQMRCNYMQLLADLFVFSLFVFDTGANPLQSWKLYIVSTRDEHFLASFWSPEFPYFQGQTCGFSFRQ